MSGCRTARRSRGRRDPRPRSPTSWNPHGVRAGGGERRKGEGATRMDGMILAAGLGTRLRPITDRIPKALVEVEGTPMLERVAHRLIHAGVDRLVINVHHHADKVRRFVRDEGFGVDMRISEEPDAALETGGGLLHAREHFRRDAPFFLHNVDVVSEIPLGDMYAAHMERAPLATLAVSDRESSRGLRFDDQGLERGWTTGAEPWNPLGPRPAQCAITRSRASMSFRPPGSSSWRSGARSPSSRRTSVWPERGTGSSRSTSAGLCGWRSGTRSASSGPGGSCAAGTAGKRMTAGGRARASRPP